MSKPMNPQMPPENYYEEDEIDLKELFKTLLLRKYTILATTLLVILIASIYVYLKPMTYESYSIVDIKTEKSNLVPSDISLGGLSSFTNDDVDKEMALYKTYSVNKRVLELLPHDVQYFVENNFKKDELYLDAPISISDIDITNQDFFTKQFTIYPYDNEHFTLKITDKGLFGHFNKPIIEQKYIYDTPIKTENFEFTVTKKLEFLEPCLIKFNGTKREIYENIIKNKLTVSRLDKKSSLIKISYRDNISKRGEAYVDTLAKVFSALNVSEKSERNGKMLNSINSQLDDIRVYLDEAENEIEAYKVSQNIVKPNQQSISLIEKLSKIDFELTQAELKYSIVKKISKSTGYSQNIASISLSLSELGNQKISTLFDALQIAQLKASELNVDFKETFPELKKVRMKITNIEQKIRLNINSLQSTLLNKINGLKTVKLDSENILKTLPEKERKLINFNRNYDVNSKMYTYLLQLKSEKTITQSSILSDFKVVDKAYTNLNSAKPKRSLILIVAAITGLILGIFLAFLREFFDDDIKDFKSIENYTDIPVLGSIPLLKKKALQVEVFENRHSAFSESFRELRNNIKTLYGSKKSNVILVTSTISTEGKTLTSANLGGILSLANYKCVIINLDLRKPTLHKHFFVSNTKGVSTYLQGKDQISTIIKKTKYDNLDIIPAGPKPQNPSELLLKEELNHLLTHLKETYDYIIIDTAPIGLVTDSLELLNSVDLNLFVMREGVSKKEYIKNLNRMIQINHISNVAIIANGIYSPNNMNGYGYGYGSNYGYTEATA